MSGSMFVIENFWVRLIASIVLLILLVLFLFPFYLGVQNLGNILGTLACVCGLLFFAANPIIAKILQKIWENGIGHVVLCVFIGILSLSGVLAVVISGFMIHTMNDKPKEENPVVVLGCQVKNGGPSLMLKRRLDAAYAYLTEHPDVPVIVCGGQGPDEAISEAQCMFEYLTGKGIAADRIYQENTSTSTYENLRNAKEILQDESLGSQITIVTDGFHQLRTSMIADDLNLKTSHVSAYTSWYLLPTYWVREWLGVCYQFVFG
ncbi:MAG: YdcF family protein [Ruminococcus sp.]|nr:YdcF family protein [Ruminococcus sp.]